MKPAFPGALAFLLIFLSAAFPPPARSAGNDKKQLTIEDISRLPASEEPWPKFLEWSPDGKRLSFLRQNSADGREELCSIDPATGQSSVLVSAERLARLLSSEWRATSERERDNRARYGVAAYHWAPNSQGVLFDAAGQLWFHNLQSGQSTQLTNAASTATDPKFSPDSDYVSYVRKHDLFLRGVASGKETQLTASGSGSILNGEVDWVYQEELDVRSNYFWSPDATHIAYLQMDETLVPSYPIVDWMPTHPTTDYEKYPKAGDANPAVRLGVVDLNGHSKWLNFPSTPGMYVPRFGWLNARIVWVLTLNRAQNQEELYFIDSESGQNSLVLSETDDAYIEMSDGLHFLEGSSRFLWPSWRDGHTHLYLYDYEATNPLARPARLVRQITRGDWEVLGLNCVDEKKGIVYFTANKDDWRQSQLFETTLDGGPMRRLTPEQGSHNLKMPKNAEFFVDSFSALAMPPRTQLCNLEGKCKQIWRSKGMEDYDVLPPKFVDFRAEDGTVLHGVVLLPAAGPMESAGKFPLILNPYAGPQGQTVRDAWSAISVFDQVMARRGFAILKVDNRGTGNRGKKFATIVRGKLGAVALKDQLAALDQALRMYPQLDRNRLGWWGWSFGGTMAAYSLTHSTLFTAAAAVAPVTDWRNYDSIYTERYMGLPNDNPDGYAESSIVQSAPKMTGHLLLVHGSSDDNVHLQHSMQLVSALVAAEREFELQVYPGKTHALGGTVTRTDLFRRIQDHFERWLAAPSAK